jgi:protoporphyrinogen oxidase
MSYDDSVYSFNGFRRNSVKISMETKVTKQCKRCEEKETRLDARYCCWCGTKFDLVIISGMATKIVPMIEPIKEAERIE